MAVSVGLGGDGDEIAAIEAVEREFDVLLIKDDATHWRRAGDLFTSLLNVTPVEKCADRHNWRRFAVALTDESGTDPDLIEPGSPLLA